MKTLGAEMQNLNESIQADSKALHELLKPQMQQRDFLAEALNLLQESIGTDLEMADLIIQIDRNFARSN